MAATRSQSGNRFIPREEFEAFERRVEQGFVNVERTLENIERKLDSRAGTDWKAIFSGLGVFATIVGLIGTLVAWGISLQVSAIGSRLEAHERSQGHVGSLTALTKLEATVEANLRRFIDYDTSLQRQFSLRDDRLDARLDALRANDGNITRRIDELRDDFRWARDREMPAAGR